MATLPAGYDWKYLRRGHVSHAVIGDVSRCRIESDVWPPPEWFGTGSQDEYEKADRLPRCKRCLRDI